MRVNKTDSIYPAWHLQFQWLTQRGITRAKGSCYMNLLTPTSEVTSMVYVDGAVPLTPKTLQAGAIVIWTGTCKSVFEINL